MSKIIFSQVAQSALKQAPNIVTDHSDEFMSTLQEINRDIQDVSKKLEKAESIDSFTEDQDDDEDPKNEDSLMSKEDEKFK